MPGALPLSVIIPTYGRGEVMVDTVEQLLSQRPPVAEVIVVDQTRSHDPETLARMDRLQRAGAIRWLRRAEPSQPGALNLGLSCATQPYVLFLDDDIRVGAGFAAAHLAAFVDDSIWAVAGQVLQPGESPDDSWVHRPEVGPFADSAFRFRSARPTLVCNGMSGNLSVRTGRARAIGGFDENFLPPVSYRFDEDFCKRLVAAGGLIRFEPRASIDHLRAPSGGTRSLGSHLTSASPMHGIGDYYFALKRGISWGTARYILRRPFREVMTRFHASHPWWIPVKFLGELRALAGAIRVWRQGPRYLPPEPG